jgi:SAM-dependent methyltransferase
MKYQDLVIKDGRFIGEFEKMYQLFEDPWNQTKEGYVENSFSRQLVINYIKSFKIKNIIEYGCGLGKTVNFIYQNTGINILGIDISETSIIKAKKKYPNLKFKVDNILNIENYTDYDCYFFSEITWYLLEDNMIDNLFKTMSNKLKGKYLIHNLVFYKGLQKYGNNYFSNLNEFIKFCPFELIGKVEIDIKQSDTIETSIIFKIK